MCWRKRNLPQKYRRYAVKSKEAKQIIAQASQKLKINLGALFGAKVNVEVMEGETDKLFLVDGKPTLFAVGDLILPTLNSEQVISQLPKIVVDMGAVKFVCNGADVMAPGVVRYEGVFGKGDLAVVIDAKHGKPLALGEMLFGLEEAKSTKKGAVMKSRHFVSDAIWNFAKLLADQQ
jgi:PUA-domain protein